jgi:hypothetical protein
MFKKLMLALVVCGLGIWTIPGCGDKKTETKSTETKTETKTEVKDAKK